MTAKTTEKPIKVTINARTYKRFCHNLTNAAKRSGLKGIDFYYYLKRYVEEFEKIIEEGEF